MESTLNSSALYHVAEIDLVYKTIVKAFERLQLGSSKDAYNILVKSWDNKKIEFVEQFKVLLLNKAQKVLGIYDVSTGGISGTVADLRIIFVAALKANACGMVISHNHPSGNL